MYPHCTSPLALPLHHLLSSLLLLRRLFRDMWLAGCVRWPDSKSLTHSLYKFPFFYFLPGFTYLRQLVCTHPTSIHPPHHHPPLLMLQRISPSTPFLCFLPHEPLLWSISVSCGQQGVCVRWWPCPVKYRLFKEVSNIIWLLYCNYKLLLLEMVYRESCPQALAESISQS